ncbi:hypothetical protein AAG570_003368 [Ranatra chinensis]|uniref:Boule n=1 Tax=Ranatra chinensis TaxID=642074 RepID=A0ABD0Y3G9_9HEMI
MESKHRNMCYENKKQETTEIETSPNPYLMYSTARNVYSSRTPSPLEYAVTSSSGGGIVYTAATAVPGSSTGQQVLFPMPPSVGQYHHVYSPTSPSLLPPQPTAHQVQLNYDGTQQILGNY